MKRKNFSSVVSLAVSLVLLSACGGSGDDDAGSPTAFSVHPESVTFTAAEGTPAGVCVAGGSVQVSILGGAAPYQIRNSFPDYVTVTPSEVGKNGIFTVTTTAGCLKPGTITVIDKLNNAVTFVVNNAPAGETS